MDWGSFSERLLPKVLKLAGLEHTLVSRNAAAKIITAAIILAAEKKVLKSTLLHPYMEICQDSDVLLRKTALSNLKLFLPKVEPSEVERLFFSELVMHLNDPNGAIRLIIIDVIVSFHQRFSTQCLENDFVPVLIKEFEQGWKEPDHWLLQNCAHAVNFLVIRKLLQDEHVPIINKFFDVINLLKIIGRIMLA